MGGRKKEDYNRLKEILLEKKRKMWNSLRDEIFRELGEGYHDQFDIPQDIEDRAFMDLIEDIGLTLADIKCQELTNMDEAMLRLDEGTYGICTECGVEIEEERLKVMPVALYCVKCQQHKELGE
ncbi:MAG: TraR/DksA family transcriptional regulator [Thermodesulfobacteriota bacterium]